MTEELMRTIPAADVQFQSACSRSVMKTIAVRALLVMLFTHILTI
jgi:hypothetical protein